MITLLTNMFYTINLYNIYIINKYDNLVIRTKKSKLRVGLFKPEDITENQPTINDNEGRNRQIGDS